MKARFGGTSIQKMLILSIVYRSSGVAHHRKKDTENEGNENGDGQALLYKVTIATVEELQYDKQLDFLSVRY